MNRSIELETADLAGLECVAEGRSAALPETVADRLVEMGLAQHDLYAGKLQLTSAGLDVIRSSDQ